MTEHCHLYSFLIAHRFALSISQFCSKSDPNVSNSSSLRLASLSLSLSLSFSHSDWCLSLKDRCFTLSFAQINVSLLVGRFLDGSLSFCLVPPWWWWLVVVEVVVSWVWWLVVGWVCWLLGFGLYEFWCFEFEMFWCLMGFVLNGFWCLVAKKMQEKKQKLTNPILYPKRNSHLYYFLLLLIFIFIF